MKKFLLAACVSALAATTAQAETEHLSVVFKGGVKASNTDGNAVFGVLAEGSAPFGSVTLQASKDGKTSWKNFTKPFELDDTGEAVKRVSNMSIAGSFIRAVTYGQNDLPKASVAKKEQ